MPVTYTNRKGRKYFLCQGITKTGKSRYFFSQNKKGKILEAIPEGFEITESVNGIVSLSKSRPKLLMEDEISIVNLVIKKHPHAKKYRLDIKPKEMIIYEQVGPDLQELVTKLEEKFGSPQQVTGNFNRRIEEEYKIHTQYTPIMKFILADLECRLFRAQRMCYLGSIEDWIDIEDTKPIKELANALVPILGTNELFQLF